MRLYDAENKMYYRPNTSDQFILKEQHTYSYLLENCKDKVVLDLGANIGAFSNNALRKGAKKVYAFEPDTNNIKIIKRQPFYSEFSNFKLFELAVAQEKGEAWFYVNSKKNKGCHSLIERRGREAVTVRTIGMQEVISKIKPDIVKVDIEGAELLIDKELFGGFEYIAIELHFDKAGKLEPAKELMEFLKKNYKELSSDNQSRVAEDKFWRLAFFVGKRKAKGRNK